MVKKFLKIAGVKTQREFYNKYPTEASFFKAHPEARKMAMGGQYHAANGLEVPSGDPPDYPRQEDYPDYGSYYAALENYLSNLQHVADTSTPQEAVSQQNIQQPIVSQSVDNSESSYETPASRPLYEGPSIVDFLQMQGLPSDFATRKKMASMLNIPNYRGTASQNTEMLQSLIQHQDMVEKFQKTAEVMNIPKVGAVKGSGRSTPKSLPKKKTKSTVIVGEPESSFNKDMSQGDTDYTGVPYNEVLERKMPGYIKFGRGSSFLERAPVNQPQPWKNLTPRYIGNLSEPWDRQGKTNKKFYAEAFDLFKQQSEQGKTPFVPYRLNSNVADIYKLALKDFNSQLGGYEYGGSTHQNDTYSAGVSYGYGGSYVPDYSSHAYGLPQFGMGAYYGSYEDGGMAQQMPPQQQGGGSQEEQIVQAVAQMLQQGMPPEQIVQQLAQAGIPQDQAVQIVQAIMQQMQQGGGQEMMPNPGGPEPNGVQEYPEGQEPMEGMPQEQMAPAMAKGGITPGWEGYVSEEEMKELRRKGYKFDVI